MTESHPLLEPRLERVADCVIEVGRPIDIGQTPRGRRRLIPIVGGRVNGPQLFAKVLPGGADFQLITTPTQAFIDRFAAVYTPAVFVLALGVALLGPWPCEAVMAGSNRRSRRRRAGHRRWWLRPAVRRGG